MQTKIKKIWIYILAAFAFLFFLQDGLFLYNSFHPNRPVLGLKMNGTPLDGQNQSALESEIKIAVRHIPPISLIYRGKLYPLAVEEVGGSVNIPNTINDILAVGRRGGLGWRMWTQDLSALRLFDYRLTGNVSKSLVAVAVADLAGSINTAPVPIHPDFSNDMSKTLPASDGVSVDVKALISIISQNIFTPPDELIPIPVVAIKAGEHTEEELVFIRKEAAKHLLQTITINYANQKFILNPSDIKNLLTVAEVQDPKNSAPKILQLRLDVKKINKALDIFAEAVQKNTHSEFNDHDMRVAVYSAFYSGKSTPIVVPAQKNPAPLTKEKEINTTSGPVKKFVYITFDDGPNNTYHPMILDILKKFNVKATFFLVGQNTLNYQEIARRTIAEGHEIGNHTLTHAFLPKLTQAGINHEITEAEKILDTLAPKPIISFRPPYGGVNEIIRNDAKNFNLRLYLWDVDPRDWSEPTTDELVKRVINYTKNGSNILLHSNHLSTVKALPKILETLISQGYSFRQL